HVDLRLATARSLDIVTQAEIIDAFGEPIAADYPRYTAGTAMLEIAEKLTDAEREPAVQQYLLLIGGLRALADRQRDTGLVLDSYVLRSPAGGGEAPGFGGGP